MSATDRERERFWAYATAFGALWGALEITLGSFLHSLRLPATGLLMTALAVGLLVAQRSLLRQPGLTAATGLIAALCKSVSPGGIILGPMIGIGIEALLVEIALSVLPLPLGAFAGGALAVLWAASQGVLMQIVLYGRPVIDLLLALLVKVESLLSLPPGAAWATLIVLTAVIVVLGGMAGVSGLALGRACRVRLAPKVETVAAGEGR